MEQYKQRVDTNYAFKHPPEFWAGKLAAEHKLSGDGNRALEIAFQASEAKISGKAIGAELQKLSSGAYDKMVNRKWKHLNLKGERKAFKVLSAYLKDGAEISLHDLLDAARARIKLGVDKETVEHAVSQITEDNVFDYVDKETFDALKQATEQRFNKRLELFTAQANPQTQQDLKSIQTEIEDLTHQINRLDVKIDGELLKKLGKVTRRGQFAAYKRRIYDLIAGGFKQDKGDKVRQLKMNPAELEFKGLQTQGKASILNQKYLETGIAWDHRSTAAFETAESMSGMLSTLWKSQVELERINSQTEISEQDDKKRRALLDELKHAETNLGEYQEIFKKTQDRLNAQTQKIIAIIVGLLITVAGLTTGVGASLGFIQLAWAIGSSLLASAISQFVKAGMSRQGDFSKAEAARETVVKLMSDVLAFAVIAELTLAVDLMGIGLHTGSVAEQLFGKPALGLLKGQIENIIGGVPEAVANQLFKKHPITSLRHDIYGAFLSKLKGLPEEVIVGFIKGMAMEGFRMGQKELLTALKMDALVWTSSSSPVANKYDDPVNQETARKQFFSSDFNSWGIFVGGPKSTVGADVSALNPSDSDPTNDYHAGNLPGYLLTSIKTALWEQFAVAKLKDSLGGALETGFHGIVGQQTGNVDKLAELRGPEAESTGASSTTQGSATALSRDEQALRLVIGYLRHIGLRISDTDDPKQVRTEIQAQTDKSSGQQQKALQMFDDYLKMTEESLPHDIAFKGGRYIGQMKGKERHGKGLRRFSNGDVYEGIYRNDRRNGVGTYRWPDGETYTGEWLDDDFHGEGVYRYSDGKSYYQGAFQKDQFHGEGTFVYGDGSRYVGEWVGGMRQGLGATYDANGVIVKRGLWQNDSYAGRAKSTQTEPSEPRQKPKQETSKSTKSGKSGGSKSVTKTSSKQTSNLVEPTSSSGPHEAVEKEENPKPKRKQPRKEKRVKVKETQEGEL